MAKWKPAVNGSTPGFKPQSSGPPETREAYYSDGNPFTYCKICKWNQTHPNKYHRAFLTKGDSFDMCVAAPTHPFTQALNLIQANGDEQLEATLQWHFIDKPWSSHLLPDQFPQYIEYDEGKCTRL